MLRALFATMACLALAGCWVSEQRIFGAGDWAHVNLSGKYKRENANGDAEARVVLTTTPDGLIVGNGTDLKAGKTERTVMGLVAIEGGSGKYFLAVDRSGGKDTGDTYLIAHLMDDRTLEVFWPECEGTAPVQGMRIKTDGPSDEAICEFTTRAALMTAGLQAEKFLAAKHVIGVAPLGRLAPDDGTEAIDAR